MTRGMSREELLALGATTDLRTAARALGAGKSWAYEAAADGTFPVRLFRVGSQYRVVTEHLLTFLGIDRSNSEAAPTTAAATAEGEAPDR